MSPLVWDLGHIAAFEDLWISGRGTGMEPLRPDLMEVYDATETPRAGRGDLPYLRCAEALDYMERVRERALRVLDEMDLSPGLGDLHSGGFLWELLVQHEHQHTETMLQCLQLAAPGHLLAAAPSAAVRAACAPRRGMARVEAGPFEIGDAGPLVRLRQRAPAPRARTCRVRDRPACPSRTRDFAEFVRRRRLRRAPSCGPRRGWAWRMRDGVERPAVLERRRQRAPLRPRRRHRSRAGP